jgi:von Willebrand factor A domain-containing protein 7
MRLIACTSLALLCASPLVESQRIRYGPGVCGPLDPTYVKIATETGGQPYPVSPEELGKSAGIMGSSFLRQMILWASGEREQSYEVPVDSTVTRMMLSATFDGTGGSVAVMAPDGNVVRPSDGVEDTSLNCGRVIIVDAPATGRWQVRVTPTSRFWLTVHAKSDLSLAEARFVKAEAGAEPGRLVRIQGEPIAGRPATLRVSLESPIENPSFLFVSLDARPIQAIDLQSTDSGEFSGTVDLPHEAFRVVVRGRDGSGLPVQRIWPGLFHAEPIEIVPPGGRTITAGATLPVTFTLRNHGPTVRLSLVAVDDRGKLVVVDPPALDLAAGAEGSATVRVVAPADAQPQSEVGIRLTATGDSTAAVGGFNSAKKTLTVIRE